MLVKNGNRRYNVQTKMNGKNHMVIDIDTGVEFYLPMSVISKYKRFSIHEERDLGFKKLTQLLSKNIDVLTRLRDR